jgi:hypothetical protein
MPFAYYDPASSSWRTSQGSLLPDSESLPPTWPRSGMWADGAASELLISERHTGGSESSSLLPTPSAYESTPTEEFSEEVRESLTDPHKRLYLPGRKWHAQRTLARMAGALLPTPTGDDANNVTRESGDFQSLAREANKLLPTPVVTDSYGSRRSTARTEEWISNPGTSLTDAIWETQGRETDTKGNLLPTPAARDRKGKSARDPNRSDNGKPRTDRERPLADLDQLLPTPKANVHRASRRAMVEIDQWSAPALEQAAEIAEGKLPREFKDWDEVPGSTGASMRERLSDGKNSPESLPVQLTIEDV